MWTLLQCVVLNFLHCTYFNIGTTFGVTFTLVFYLLIDDSISSWFSQDATLQSMILELVPLACVGNITMAIGMLCWSLIGAQGRFRLATLISFLSGWLVTVPLGALFVYGMNFDLQGLVAAVTLGYSVSGTVLMYLLIRSNWDKRIEKVRRATSMGSEVDLKDEKKPTEVLVYNNGGIGSGLHLQEEIEASEAFTMHCPSEEVANSVRNVLSVLPSDATDLIIQVEQSSKSDTL